MIFFKLHLREYLLPDFDSLNITFLFGDIFILSSSYHDLIARIDPHADFVIAV